MSGNGGELSTTFAVSFERGVPNSYNNDTRRWDEASGDVIRMVMYINWGALPSSVLEVKNGEKQAMGRLLNMLIVLQRTAQSSSFAKDMSKIWYSDGTSISATKSAVVEYIVTFSVLGLLPWIIFAIAAMIARTSYSWWRPNQFFELNFVMFRTFTSSAFGPVLCVPRGRIIFTSSGLFFVQEVQEERRVRGSGRKIRGKTFRANHFP